MAKVKAVKPNPVKPVAPTTPPKVLDFARMLGTKLSPHQAVLLKASRCDQYPTVTDEELSIFTSATGRTTWPSTRPWLTVVVAGIRSGKGDRFAKIITAWEALFGGHAQHAAPGEEVVIPLVAQDMKASGILMGYCKAALKAIGQGFSVVTDDYMETVRLTNGVAIRRYPPSPTALRGISAPFWCWDEAAHAPREGAAASDVDLFTVLRGRQISFPASSAIITTSPWDKSGVVYDLFAKHHADSGDPDILIWQSPTWAMNPSAKIERERRLLSPAVFAREIGAQFADSIEGFLSAAMLQAATDTGITERLPQRRQRYFGAVDTSGGKHDTFTCAVAHLDGGQIVVDKVTGWTSADFKRLRTRGVVTACAEVLRRYGVATVHGDRYAGSTYPDMFAEAGIAYRTPVSHVRERGRVRAVHADRTAIYSTFEEVLNDCRVRLVDHPAMLRQFQRLERRYSADVAKIDHPSSGSDDYANAAALAVFVAEGKLSREARQKRMEDEDARPDDAHHTDFAEHDAIIVWAREHGLIPPNRDELEPHEVEHLRREMDSARFMGDSLAARLERAGLR